MGEILNHVEKALVSVAGANDKLATAKEALNRDEGAMALEELATELGEAADALNPAVRKLEIIKVFIEGAPFLPEEVQMTVQAVKQWATSAEEAASTAKSAVGVAKGKADAFIVAQEKAEAAHLLVEQVEKIVQMVGAIEGKVHTVGANIAQILKEIKTVNPTAKLYVMGYYNALPYLGNDIQTGVTLPLLEGLNRAIQTSVHQFGAINVPTFDLFEGNYETFLPEPTNIHPSEAGYSALTERFMEEISKSFPGAELEKPRERGIELGEKVSVSKGEFLLINGTSVNLLLPENLPVGTTLTVTATDENILGKAKGLKSVGNALNFDFQFPPGEEEYEGEYNLVMGYHSDLTDALAIYYYNETKGVWERQGGKVKEASKEISLNVSRFSNYGVFVLSETDKAPPKTGDNDTPGAIETSNYSQSNSGAKKGSPERASRSNDSDFSHFGSEVNQLPNTATNNYNWLVLGAILIGAGLILLSLIRKKTVKP